MSTPDRGWYKSSYSSQTNSCVEVNLDGSAALVRDTKNRAAGTVAFSAVQWERFLASATGR